MAKRYELSDASKDMIEDFIIQDQKTDAHDKRPLDAQRYLVGGSAQMPHCAICLSVSVLGRRRPINAFATDAI